jgi:hypothetical protein
MTVSPAPGRRRGYRLVKRALDVIVSLLLLLLTAPFSPSHARQSASSSAHRCSSFRNGPVATFDASGCTSSAR